MKPKIIFVLSIAWMISFSLKAQTIQIPNGDTKALIQAIQKANQSTSNVTIALAKGGVYTFKSAFGLSKDPNGNQGSVALPVLEAQKKITINGNGATIKKASGSADFRLLFTEQKVEITISNLSMEGFKTGFQGGIFHIGFNSTFIAKRCNFSNNQTTANVIGGGGVLYCKSLSSMTFENCTFKGNSARNNGGAINCLLSDLTLVSCQFVGNKLTNASGNTLGGAIYIDGANGDNGKINITTCKFEKNEAGIQGGAIYAFPYNNNSVTIEGCEFFDNQVKGVNGDKGLGGAFAYGSGVFTKGSQGYSGKGNTTKLSISNSSFYNNSAFKQGGGIYLSKGVSKITNCTFAYNKVGSSSNKDGFGGGIAIGDNEVQLLNCTIAYNQAAHTGGGIYGGGNVSVKNCIIAHNKALNNGNKWNMHQNCSETYRDGGNNLEFPALSANKSNVACTKNVLNKDPLLGSFGYSGGSKVKIFILKKDSPALSKKIGSGF